MLKSFDEMNVTPLHVLIGYPNATLNMIKKLASKCPDAAIVENKNSIYPVDLYLLTQNVLNVTWTEQRNKIRYVMESGVGYNIYKIIISGVTY